MQGLLYLALLPVIFLLGFIYKKDVDKEPRGTLIKAFVLGAISVIPIVIVELVFGVFFPSENLPTFMGTFVAVFLTIALVEEFGKWIFVYITAYRKREFNHIYDGIVYAVFTSLGFAAVENILYVLQSGVGTGILRALLAVPGHAVDAVFMGYFLSKSKDALVKNNNSNSLVNLILSIMVPSITHAIYDSLIIHFTSSEDTILLIAFFGFVITSYVVSFILINKLSKVTVNFDGSAVQAPVQNVVNQPVPQQSVVQQPVQNAPVQTMCRNCGAPLNGNSKCSYCGFIHQ